MLEVCNYVSNERKANWRMDVVHRMDEEHKAWVVLRSVLTIEEAWRIRSAERR